MNYYIDTEFLEGTQKYGQPWFNFWLGQKAKEKPTIDLISIGIVAEDGREYYAISKDFNLREAWDRFDLKPDIDNGGMKKVYWIRENVLKPIFNDWNKYSYHKFNYKNFRYMLNMIGKSNHQIAEEVKEFTLEVPRIQKHGNPKFYAYFADYDWVAFCWLFGKMNNLPNGFPKYCIDLKQEIDRIIKKSWKDVEMSTWGHTGIENIERLPNYPKQTNEHNALADARWNKELHEFIQSL